MANNVLPDPLNINIASQSLDPVNVNISSPDPLPVEIATPVPVDVNISQQTLDPINVNIASPNPLPVSLPNDPLPVEVVGPLNEANDAVLVETKNVVRFGIVTHVYGDVTAQSTVAVAIVSQDRDIVLVDSTGFLVGDSITNLVAASDRTFPTIVAIVGNTITLDKLIDGSYPIGTIIEAVPVEMNVLGVPASPTIFKVKPPIGQVWHLTRVMITMTHSSAGDMGKFGGIPALTYGLLGRVLSGGSFISYTNWKANSDMGRDMYDIRFDARSGGGGDFGTTCRFTFTNLGTAIELDGNDGDELQFLVQDDLTGLDSFEIGVQGNIH